MNTKHKVHNFDKCSAQFKTLMKLLNHRAECQGRGKKGEVYYGEFCFCSKTKKNLKAHNSKSHSKKQFTLQHTTKAHDPKECDICGDRLKREDNLK